MLQSQIEDGTLIVSTVDIVEIIGSTEGHCSNSRLTDTCHDTDVIRGHRLNTRKGQLTLIDINSTAIAIYLGHVAKKVEFAGARLYLQVLCRPVMNIFVLVVQEHTLCSTPTVFVVVKKHMDVCLIGMLFQLFTLIVNTGKCPQLDTGILQAILLRSVVRAGGKQPQDSSDREENQPYLRASFYVYLNLHLTSYI